ncbi:MAG TPA: glycosyltransferase family 2 protein [Candidatus Binatia bacterium]|jgi:glycosyltransferase involved in cell wall biosynthesis
MAPLVSILIPAYNAERWIGETIRSALAQTWSNTEVIVVDDGSTDRTLQIARQFEAKGVLVVTQPNQGAAAARNKAFSLSHGDYIQWLDADDLLSSAKVARQMQKVQQIRDQRMLFSSQWASFIYRPGKARFVPTPLWCDLDPTEWLTRKWEGNWHVQTATWLVSRELSEAAGPWDTRLLVDDDGEYFSRVIGVCGGIRFIPESKIYYRVTPSTRVSHIGRSDKKMEAQLLAMKLQIGYLRAREDSDRVRAACMTYLQDWLPNFYPDRPDLVQEAQQLAESLGGRLSLPKASWKFAWVEKLFGFAAAKHTQSYYNQTKSSLLRAWDKMMYRLERDPRLPR